ncbi:MAG TPA: fibronectin type III domain-containing protein [Acidimicrobiia bacterium]|nr:fibronectin type III domain-containing protein [Acidimicrobiia bacterium]
MTRGSEWRARALLLPLVAAVIGTTLVAQAGSADALAPANTTLVSAAASGAPSGQSDSSSASSTGRFVAFTSTANNLVADDSNGVTDVFRRDTQTGTTIRVSVTNGGSQLNDASSDPAISADGRYVAFISASPSVVSGDTNDAPDVFVRDTQSATTTLVSVDTTGVQAPDGADEVAISGDGRWVAFSTASALISTDTNEGSDIYARDTVANTTTRITVAAGGWEPAVNGDGRYYTFTTTCGTITCIFRKDRVNGNNVRVSNSATGTLPNGASYNSAITSDGTKIAFESEASNQVSPADANGTVDVYLRNMTTSSNTRVTVSSSGGETNNWSFEPSVSDDGRYVAFSSLATNHTAVTESDAAIDVYVRDLSTGVTERFSRSPFGTALDGDSAGPVLAGDGSALAYTSFASNVVAGTTTRGQVYRTLLSNATAPTAPQNVSATGANASATVTWTVPASNGGSALTSYLVTSTPGGLTATAAGDATSTNVTGLTNGVTYTFTVRAQNAVGYGDASAASNPVTPSGPSAVAPSVPQTVTAIAGNAAATVSWSTPASDGGSPITGYVATSTPGGFTASAGPAATSVAVTGLTNGTPYTFTVHAQNVIGDSPESTPSNVVTPAMTIAAPTISIGDTAVVEGDTGSRTVRIPVTLLRAATTTVTVDYVISGSNATGNKQPGPGVDINDRGQTTRALKFLPSLRTGLTPVVKYVAVSA